MYPNYGYPNHTSPTGLYFASQGPQQPATLYGAPHIQPSRRPRPSQGNKPLRRRDPKLPLDVITLIIEQVDLNLRHATYPRTWEQTLRACSLICRPLREFAQRRIFRSVRVAHIFPWDFNAPDAFLRRYQTYSRRRLLALLSLYPYLGRYVQEYCDDLGSGKDSILAERPKWNDLEQIQYILAAMPNLRELWLGFNPHIVRPMNWEPWPHMDVLRIAVYRAVRQPHFQKLHICKLWGVPVQLFYPTQEYSDLNQFVSGVFDEVAPPVAMRAREIDISACSIHHGWRKLVMDTSTTRIPVNSLLIRPPRSDLSLKYRGHVWQEFDFFSTCCDLSPLEQFEFKDFATEDAECTAHQQLAHFLAKHGARIKRFSFQPCMRYACHPYNPYKADPLSLTLLPNMRELHIDFYTVPTSPDCLYVMPEQVLGTALRWLRGLLRTSRHPGRLRILKIRLPINDSAALLPHERVLDDYLSEMSLFPNLRVVSVSLHIGAPPVPGTVFFPKLQYRGLLTISLSKLEKLSPDALRAWQMGHPLHESGRMHEWIVHDPLRHQN